MKNGSWEDFKERYRREEKSLEWTFERIRESCEKVARDEVGRLGIVAPDCAICAFHLAHLSAIELQPGEKTAQDKGRERRILGELLDVSSRENRGTNSAHGTIGSGSTSQYFW